MEICLLRKRRRRRWLELAVLLCVGLLCLLIIWKMDVGDKSLENVSESEDSSQEIETTTPPDLPTITGPKCIRNSSASNVMGFSELPTRVQNFLYHRHCRHFPMLLNSPRKCGGPEASSDVFLLLVIKSSPANYDRREVLRKTWAAERQQNGVWIRTLFISGTTGENYEKQRLNKLLEVENREYQDILQWDFNDSFYNLTLKQILFLQWMDKWCPNAQFLLNGDDDIFANTDNMVVFLQGLGKDGAEKHLFVGQFMQWMGPIRESGSKYFVPIQVYEGNAYPPYCSGGGYLLSRFTCKTIFNMSHSIPILPIDDAYMGLCLEKAGLKPTSHIGVLASGLIIPGKDLDPYDPCYYREIILVHRFLPHQIYIMWHEIHRPDLKCGKMFGLKWRPKMQ